MCKLLPHSTHKIAALAGILKCTWLVAVLGMAMTSAGCAAEPTWEGKPLSTWLGQLNDPRESRSNAAEAALRGIGTNAIPYLLARLAATPPSFGESLGEKQSEAVLAFRVLGKTAIQSLPALGNLLTNNTPGSSLDPTPVVQSMAGIGKEAQPWLVEGLSDARSKVRRASLLGLIDLGKKAEDALPSVQQRLRDDDPEIRGFALFFISSVSKDKDLKTSLLKTALQDPDPHVRLLAEKELAKLTSE
jgi:hypothetical protein